MHTFGSLWCWLLSQVGWLGGCSSQRHLAVLPCPPVLFAKGEWQPWDQSGAAPGSRQPKPEQGFWVQWSTQPLLFPGVPFALFEPWCTIAGRQLYGPGGCSFSSSCSEDAEAGTGMQYPELPFLWDTQLGTCVHPASSLQWGWCLWMLDHQGLRSAPTQLKKLNWLIIYL